MNDLDKDEKERKDRWHKTFFVLWCFLAYKK